MTSLLQLCAELGPSLRPAPGVRVSASPLSGVHVSELDDPTPYLEGGELLLTTGIPFRAGGAREADEDEAGVRASAGADAVDPAAVGAYVGRLRDKGVLALGIGLGPWFGAVPDELARAAAAAGVELVVVPDDVPFLSVSRAYWRLVARDGQAGLIDSLGTQAALARAAMLPNAASAVVRGLAQALGGWAAYMPAGDGAAIVWPQSAAAEVPRVRAETMRFNRSGAHASVAFGVGGKPVVAYPIASGSRTHGFLAIVTDRALVQTDRYLIMTVSTLLALKARQRETVAETTRTLGAAAARLLFAGEVEAARMVAEDVGLAALPARARVLGLRVRPGDDAALAVGALGCLVLDPGLPAVAAAAARCSLLYRDDDGVFLILEPGALPSAPSRSAARGADAVSAVVGAGVAADAGAAEERGADARAARAARAGEDPHPLGAPGIPGPAAAVLSEPVPVSELPAALAAAKRVLRSAPTGRVGPVAHSGEAGADAWAEALARYARADLVGTVTAYLRHRGSWEAAARELEVHRNSLRYRIRIASSLIGADLDDADTAAHLWLALRRRAHEPAGSR